MIKLDEVWVEREVRRLRKHSLQYQISIKANYSNTCVTTEFRYKEKDIGQKNREWMR